MATSTLGTTAGTLGARLKACRGVLVLVILGFIPLLLTFFVLSWQRPAYQFFPMALFAAGLLAWRAVSEPGRPVAAGSARVTRWLIGATGGLWLLANILWSPWLGFIIFLLALTTALWWLGGKPLLRAFGPAILMLVAVLPPPLNWDVKLTVWLRSVAVHASCGFLDWLPITLVQDGNTIQLPGKNLFVEEACSGINSFVLGNAFCLFWILWQRRSLWWLLPAMLCTSVFVVLGNIIRITTCAAVYHRWQIDLLDGWRHETFGLLLLLGYCVLIMSTEQLFDFLTRPNRLPAPKAQPAAVKGEPAVPSKAGAVPDELSSAGQAILPVNLPPPVPGTVPVTLPTGPTLGLKLASVLLAVLGLGFLGLHLVRSRGQDLAVEKIFHSSRELKLELPPSLAGWHRNDTNSGELSLARTLGVHSISWRFQNQGLDVILAVDYPLDGFHDVASCYDKNGWQIKREEEVVRPQNHEDLHAIKLTLEQDIRHAVVYHSVMDEEGTWLSAKTSLAKRMADSVPPTGYRIQLFRQGYAPLTGAAQESVQELFFQARQMLAQQMVVQFHNPTAK